MIPCFLAYTSPRSRAEQGTAMPPDPEAPLSPRSTSRRTSSRSTRTRPAMSQLSSSPHPLPPTSNLTPAGTTTVHGLPDASRTPPRRRLLPRPPRSVRRGRRHVLARGALPGAHVPSDGTPWRPAGHLRASARLAHREAARRARKGGRQRLPCLVPTQATPGWHAGAMPEHCPLSDLARGLSARR